MENIQHQTEVLKLAIKNAVKVFSENTKLTPTVDVTVVRGALGADLYTLKIDVEVSVVL